jgi:hypothetical protein
VGGAPDLPRVAHVAEPHVIGGIEAGFGAEVAIGQAAERSLDPFEMLAPEGLASQRSRHPNRSPGGETAV